MRSIIFVMALVLISGSALAQGRWETTVSGCQVWNDHPTRQGTVTWSGRCHNGRAQEEGILEWLVIQDRKPMVWRYEGEMRDGDMEGRVIFIWPNGDRYEGDFFEGLRHGQGTYYWTSGNRYEGEFFGGVLQGKGVYVWKRGDRYEGGFANGLMHGPGEYVWPSGRRHQGEFDQGRLTN